MIIFIKYKDKIIYLVNVTYHFNFQINVKESNI